MKKKKKTKIFAIILLFLDLCAAACFFIFYGPIPKGYIVHHKDGNKLNNCLMNLEILKQSTHRTNHYLNSDENTTGYYRVSKWKSKSYKRGYCWVYQARKYNEGNIKRDLIIKPTLKELEEEVKRQGFEWKEL